MCLQEIHIKQSDNKYVKNNKLGREFVLLAKVMKRGIVIYAKQELQPKKVFEDNEGRYIVVEIHLEDKRTLVVGVYAPNGPKEIFLKKTETKFGPR